jgi:hypothetical protein
LEWATLTAILLLGSRAAARFDPFSFWHIPGQGGKKSNPQITQITQIRNGEGKR